MKLKINKPLISLALLLFILTPIFVLAADVELPNPLTGKTEGNFEEVIKNVTTATLGISGVLALVAFIYGGITWMTSSGDTAKITKGKNMMIWAVWGIVIIFASYAILSFVFKALTGDTDI
ncbi:MAG: hypothetical protein A3B89_04390 [Candidatus Buchananbacteria bacterium RIFCSPHIGHO2_02_FULL_40_13]|nr:MAG: hypothetical protein A2820_00360 [Candidatus Buchananbacteria bacterium RIFCSPHIGHO2_01_FULL_40_35]OGY49707.1 MAG: hypothetical protein A3B89_04390 [Candidatus Buchananbacteria bacterium RIFCSPHIGHO2_02_FULL_40_13]